MASSSKAPPPQLPDEEEDDHFSIGDDDDDGPQMDFMSLLISGEGVPIGETFAEISRHLETQNKILIKILSVLLKK